MIIPSYYTPQELNLKGRLPEDLPNKSTIEDILLELLDTGLFTTRWVDTSQFDWRANNKSHIEWIERGKAVVHRAKFDSPPFTGKFIKSNMTVEETHYDIFRYPIRLNVETTLFQKPPGEQSNSFKDINEVSKNIYDRLLNYIGNDVIQDQFLYTNFVIDFMISEIKII